MMLERLDRSCDRHRPYDPRGEFVRLRDGEHVRDYMRPMIAEGQLFVGSEGEAFMSRTASSRLVPACAGSSCLAASMIVWRGSSID